MSVTERDQVEAPRPTLSLASDGVTILRNVLSAEQVEQLVGASGAVARAGVRNALGAIPPVRRIVESEQLTGVLRQWLGSRATLTRAILFDKHDGANWAVPWHQDTVIGVRERIDVPGFGPWSVKQGVTHVRAPARILESMLTVRVHIDAADASNGALMILRGTHREGILDDNRIRQIASTTEPTICEARAGDAVLMRPLLLHASARSTSTRRRRVLHLEYACGKLPGGLRWAEA